MPLLADRVKESTTTQGTGTLTLAGAPPGFRTFTGAFGNGASVYYVIAGPTEWEIGFGTTGAGTLTRDTVFVSSAGGTTKVNLSAGSKDVFCSYVADRAVTTSDAATLTNKIIDDYTNNVGANTTHFRVKATGTLAKGAVVKATGFNPGEQAIEVAATSSASDVAIGFLEQALTTGQFGTAVAIGELFNVNTNGLAVGATLYSNNAGSYTTTKPSSGFYQSLGWVVRANTSNGVIAVNVVAPLYVEASTNTANTSVLRDGSGNFAAGTITAALTGNASTATALQTARNINGVSFNGTADITVTAAAGTLSGTTLASGVTASSLTSVGTLTSLAVSGQISANGGVQIRNGSFGAGRIYQDGGLGLVTAAIAGSTNDWTLVNPSGASIIAKVATGTTTFDIIGSATVGGTLAVSGNGVLQTINGSASAFTDYRIGGVSQARVGTQNFATGDLSLLTLTSAPIVFATNNIEQMRLNASGNLGIGTNNPLQRLHVAGSVFRHNDATNSFGYTISAASAKITQAATAGGIYFAWQTNGSGTDQMTLDTSGNLGLGVTPSPWDTSIFRTVQLGTGAGSVTLSGRSDGTKDMVLGSNLYYATGQWRYVGVGAATKYRTDGAVHSWHTAPSGTADNAIAFTQAMTLDASGNLLVGLTSTVGAAKAAVAGTIVSSTNTLSTFSGAYGGFDWVSRSLRVFAGSADATNSQIEFYAGVSGAISERFRIKGPGQVRFIPLAAAPTTNVEDGDVYYDSGTNKLRVRAGGAWTDLH